MDPEDINVTFNDVKGCDEAKQELHEIVEFLKNPNKFSQLGGKLPKGVLLVGPPGELKSRTVQWTISIECLSFLLNMKTK